MALTYSYDLFGLHLYCFWMCCHRFTIDRATDQEMTFYIDPDSGAITLGKILDRETAGWHNITVKAVEAGKPIPSHFNSNCVVHHIHQGR